MQSVFGIAKNVNGRRVATAYHLGGSGSGRASNSTTTATPGEQQQLQPGSDGVILSMMKTPQSSSLVSSLSSSSLASLGGLESGPSSGSSSRLGTPTVDGNANAELTRLYSTPFLSTPKYDQEQDWHVSKHGSVVDKTNPFIGYFQTGRDSPSSSMPMPAGLPPRSTSGTGPSIREVTAMPYAALLNQPKRIADWIGSQSTRLPSMFTKREQGDKQTSVQTQQFGDQQGGKEETKGMSLLSSLKAAATSLGAGSRKDAEQRSPQQKSSLPQTELFTLQTPATSRLEQDFELVESLGQGGQGTVFKARSKIDGRFYAIKKVALSNTALDDATELEQARREAVSMAAIPPHSNVVRYHTAWIEVEPVESITSSTASVRGSDVPDEEEELGSEHSTHPNDVSFSIASSVSEYVNFENSFGGFEFEDPSQSMMSYTNGKEDEDEFSSESEKEKLAGVGKSKLTLYIQMELCGTSVGSPVREEETFDRFVDRLKQVASPPLQEQYSNLTQWLRSSVDERSAGNPSNRTKHAEGLKLFLGVAQGVSHMHSVGVIHRDLKPDNIFIHGEVAKVGDFGLSKSIFADSSKNVAQQGRDFENSDEYGDHTTALGTFTYASPEQLGHRFNSSLNTSRVKSAKYSIKSDIFALGVILLELCCPFGTMMERSQVLTAVRHGVVPQKALQRYPSEMALVLRMTAVDPAER